MDDVVQKNINDVIKNSENFITERKKQIKIVVPLEEELERIKELENQAKDNDSEDILKKKIIASNSDFCDFYLEVHAKGLWQPFQNVSFKYSHENGLSGIVNADIKVKTEDVTWKSIGANYEGVTEVLSAEIVLEKEYMILPEHKHLYNLYKKDKINQHSVGMVILEMKLAADSSDTNNKAYKDLYDEYIDKIVNKDFVKRYGYFYLVTKARLLEISAVEFGANRITPTLKHTQETINKDIEKRINIINLIL